MLSFQVSTAGIIRQAKGHKRCNCNQLWVVSNVYLFGVSLVTISYYLSESDTPAPSPKKRSRKASFPSPGSMEFKDLPPVTVKRELSPEPSIKFGTSM
jgi:hypothetical protein